MKEGRKVQRREEEKRGKWPKKEGSEEGEKKEKMAGKGRLLHSHVKFIYSSTAFK